MNCDGILSLAEAEICAGGGWTISGLGKVDPKRDLKSMYDTAISKLSRTGFVHFAGIANELAGEYMLRQDDNYWAEHYMSHALECCEGWGAMAKVRQIKQQKPFHTDNFDNNISTIYPRRRCSIRGRVRYDSSLDSLAFCVKEDRQDNPNV